MLHYIVIVMLSPVVEFAQHEVMFEEILNLNSPFLVLKS